MIHDGFVMGHELYDAMVRDRDRWRAEANRLRERLEHLEALVTALSDFAANKERVS